MKLIWNKYDNDFSGKLDKSEFIEFIKELKLHIGITPEEIFKKVDSDNSGKIDYEEFVKFFEELTSGKEFDRVFKRFCDEKSYLTVFEFQQFLKEVQKESISFSDALHLILESNNEIPSQQLNFMLEKLEKFIFLIQN